MTVDNNRDRVTIDFVIHRDSQQQPLLQQHDIIGSGSSSITDSDKMGRKYFQDSGYSLFLTFTTIIILLSFVYVVISLEATANSWRKANLHGGAEPKNLLLTPLIKAGDIREARKLARVKLFPEESYSGFLTVDETCGSHLFFWFFPASSGNSSAPLILWHGGGPGTSGMFALFQGTGPILLDEEGRNWTANKYPVTRNRSVLYLDSPVGTGFSYSEVGEICYAHSSDDVADGAILALRQFYQLFPEYVGNDLYISSSSYGGKFLPVIAWRIEDDNQLDALSGDPNLTSINLKGIISISGFSDPIHQVDYGEFYYNMGLIDGAQKKHFLSQETMGKSYIRSGNYYAAYETIDPLIVGQGGQASYLKNVTGINHPYNFVVDLNEKKAEDWMFRQNIFLNQDWVRQAIHVDFSPSRKKFSTSSDDVYSNLLKDLYKSVGGIVEDLLNLGKYKFLFTSGQFDLIVPHTTILKFLHELRWDNGYEFTRMNNSLFEFKGRVIGYGKSLDNLTYVMLRNAGHHPFTDQPECTLDLILKFTA